MIRPIAALALGACLGACAARSPDPAAPGEAASDPAPARDPLPGGPAGRPVRQGTVSRGEVDRVLDAGPGAFLGRTEVKARLDRGVFRGWEVIRPPFPEVDLVAGDVVIAVNGRALERPGDLEQLWTDLRAADAIEVSVERDGKRFTLRFAVVPGP